MKNKNLIYLAVAASIFLLIYFRGNNSISENQSPSPVPTIETVSDKVYLTLNFGGDNTNSLEFDYEEGITAYSLLEKYSKEKSVEIITKKYDFGVFVEQIGDAPSTSEMAWIYYVNNESANVAADTYILKPGDKVEWKYEKPIF